MAHKCSYIVPMLDHLADSQNWPTPPASLPAGLLHLPPAGAHVAVSGLVLVRQRPGTAKGVIFITLEDETGVANIVVWQNVYQAFRRAVVTARLLRVTGQIQRDGKVVHVIARKIEDLSSLLDRLAAGQDRGDRVIGAAVNTYEYAPT